MREKSKLITAFILIFMLGLAVGYGMGVKDGIAFSVRFASQFMTVEFDEDYIVQGLYQYQNHIGGCIKNAPIFNVTRHQV